MIGMNPCGVVFGFLRSCYSTKARMLHASNRQSTISWYFAPTGAKYFQKRNCFEPLSWSGGSPAGNTQGEVIGAPRPYSKGVTPTCAQGTTVWGEDSWFNDGVPSLTGPWVANECGLPSACPGPPCQPWFMANEAHRQVSTPSDPYYQWFATTNTATTMIFQSDLHPGWSAQSGAVDVACSGNPFRASCALVHLGVVYACTLISYNPATYTGTWQIPAGCPWPGTGPISLVLPPT